VQLQQIGERADRRGQESDIRVVHAQYLPPQSAIKTAKNYETSAVAAIRRQHGLQ
jgi:hypothetical protein